MSVDPQIFLAIDNCFAYKRWTKPMDWAKIIRELGLYYIEASADTELDPLYMGKAYLRQWVKEVQAAEQKYGVKIANLYSGHGTYTTLGLTHTSSNVRKRMKQQWFKPMIEAAAMLQAGIGFFAHAFPDYALQKPTLYNAFKEILFNNLIELNDYANGVGCGPLGLEQMYAPHHYPWRIKDTRELLMTVTERSKRDFYFTEDVGHHHTLFLKPENIRETLEKQIASGQVDGLWLGIESAYALLREAYGTGKPAGIIREIERLIEHNPHLFAEPQDCDCYSWLEQLGAYSPIIHLQQTNGTVSAHWPFTKSYNRTGIIKPGRVFQAIAQSYRSTNLQGMPRKTEKIYLTIEVFTPTASINQDTLEKLRATVAYWREYIPEDGMSLSEIIRKGEDYDASTAEKI